MSALARAHDIPLPNSRSKDAIWQALSAHHRFGTEPKLRLLLIPQSETQPLKNIELVRGPDIHQKIAHLLGCSFTDSVVLHSEDQIAYAQKRPTGVGIGRLHTSYEAWMDDNAISARPLNVRASRLLHRPNTHGAVLVQKTTFIKNSAATYSKAEDILCFEKVEEEELLGDNFRKLRAEWVRWMGKGSDARFIMIESTDDSQLQTSTATIVIQLGAVLAIFLALLVAVEAW
ncbi:hypothetical protein C8J57DRAFT_1296767 [Mycena rebaudengoi]|nr:hypothetical protein C8J57DRAFT_1296767 [Mycena rebaudengoi]